MTLSASPQVSSTASSTRLLIDDARLVVPWDKTIPLKAEAASRLCSVLHKQVEDRLRWAAFNWPEVSQRFPEDLKTGCLRKDESELASFANHILACFFNDPIFRGGTTAFGALIDSAAATPSPNWPNHSCIAFLVGLREEYSFDALPSIWHVVTRMKKNRFAQKMALETITFSGSGSIARSKEHDISQGLSDFTQVIFDIVAQWPSHEQLVFSHITNPDYVGTAFLKTETVQRFLQSNSESGATLDGCFNLSSLADACKISVYHTEQALKSILERLSRLGNHYSLSGPEIHAITTRLDVRLYSVGDL